MKEFNNIEQLVAELKNKKLCDKKILVGIDGFLGTGKTNLSNTLKTVFGANCINVIDIDDKEKIYYLRNNGSIIKHTDFNKLKNDIINFKRKTSVIFSSICLLKILKTINVPPDIYVYIKRMAKPVGRATDTWQDEYDCTFEDNINSWEDNEITKTLKFDNQTNTVNVKKSLMIRKEVVQYHQEYKPHENAKYCYLRYEK